MVYMTNAIPLYIMLRNLSETLHNPLICTTVTRSGRVLRVTVIVVKMESLAMDIELGSRTRTKTLNSDHL